MFKVALFAFSVLMLVSTVSRAATVDCTMTYPSGAQAGQGDGTIAYPDGKPMRTIDGQMFYPSGEKFLDVDGTAYFPNGEGLKSTDGSMWYPSGAAMRDPSGATFTEKGQSVALAIANVLVDANTKLVVRAFKAGSKFRLYVKTDGDSLIVNIDEHSNVACETVKPIGR